MAVLYRHIRLDTNEVFYIGIGKTIKRAYVKQDRSKFWNSIIEKTDYEVEILFDYLTDEQAREKEKEFIKLYGRRDLGTGTLVNLTDGGDGGATKGKVISEKHKLQISKANKGRKFSAEHRRNLSKAIRGRRLSDEHRKKISEAHKGEKNHFYGRKHSEETKEKIGLKSIGRDTRKKI